MIIPNKLIKLDYDPGKDILFVQWPDFDYYTLIELQQILQEVTDTVRHYDINFLMVDSRTTVSRVSPADYEEIARKFVGDLQTTRIKKIARLATDDVNRENHVIEIQSRANVPVAVRSFKTVDEALGWFGQHH